MIMHDKTSCTIAQFHVKFFFKMVDDVTRSA